MKKRFDKCFYKSVCVDGYNHPKECKSCFSFVKMTKENEHLPWSTSYWKFNKRGELIA